MSGGAPRIAAPGGCRTGSATTNNSGLWLFTRKPVDPAAKETMLAKLDELGLDASQLVPVPQEGCTYQGAEA